MSCAVPDSPLLHRYLKDCLETSPPADINVKQLIQQSAAFPVPFPVQINRCKSQLETSPASEPILERNINTTYPLVHETLLPLFCEFLEHKKIYGSEVEKKLYKGMGLEGLVHRLLVKRAVIFCGQRDYFRLLSLVFGDGGWEKIGTDDEELPLVLSDCLSYDEMKLSAFIAASSHSIFINDGNRRNNGIPGTSGTFESQGVIVGVVGPRFAKRGVMEYQEIVIEAELNTKENGYGPTEPGEDNPSFFQKVLTTFGMLPGCSKSLSEFRQMWARFYDKPHLPLYKEIKGNNQKEYTLLRNGCVFDNDVYSKRIKITAETFLLEANQRALIAGKKAYVHVVGFGLGVWRASPHQEKIFMDAFDACFRCLTLEHVTDVHFSWFTETSCGAVTDGGTIGQTGIRLHFSQRDPHVLLTGDDSGKLVVASYAWDGNSLPGNEYWDGSLWTSSDPAAASSTQVAELQNPHLNPKMSGANLHVASATWGVLHLAEYAKRTLEQS